ncbi:interleukin-13 receptor subunit alpha-1-like isoform X2 [Dendropsophus ebraccatus]|uniref:interleukin-13 receptor subunit alpha-1-like isoform X2 n=1 Tax=Dendropsophus ebraccatus TaxID=150705 RepID=UPI003831C1D2
MEKYCCNLDIIWLLLSLNVAVQSTGGGMNYLPPPTNITATMVSMMHFIITWEPIASNCTPKYEVKISSGNNTRPKSTEDTSLILDFSDSHPWLDPNDYFSSEIQAECNGMTSEWARKSHMELVPGDKRTTVRNVSCVWHYMDYISCTWQPGEDTPPNVQYKLLYWEQDSVEILSEPMQFKDLLRNGTECREYFRLDGLYLGCKFKYEKTIGQQKELLFVVTDRSHSIKPFLYYTEAKSIGKLQAPVITLVSRTKDNHLYINWTMSPNCFLLMFEVLISTNKQPSGHVFEVKYSCSGTTTIPHSDDTLRIKVRAKFSELIADNSFWSEWSKDYTLPGKDNHMLLLSLIPAGVFVLVVLLLVYLKRLKLLVFPPIPHPGKMFQNDLQNWLKHEKPIQVYDKPEQEVISPVSLLEV